MRWLVPVAFFAALQVACSSAASRPDGQVAVRAVGLPADGSVTRVAVEVSSTGVTTDLTYDGVSAWTGAVFAPAGNQTVVVKAWRGDVLVGQGSGDVDVIAGGVASAMIWVLDVTGTPPQADHGPIIVAVTATPAEIAPGGTTTLSVRALDPDGDPLTYEWTQGCSPGAFSSPQSATTEWSTPAEFVCPITVSVRAGGLTASATVAVASRGASGASGQVDVQAAFVAQPYVDRVKLTYFDMPGSNFAGELAIGRTPDTDGLETLNPSIPDLWYPGQALWFQVAYQNLPMLNEVNQPLVRVWIDDDCGGGAEQHIYQGDPFNMNEASFTWHSGPIPGLCLVDFHVEYRGLTDTFTVATVTDGCTDDVDHWDDTPERATPFFAVFDPASTPTEPVVRTSPNRWANDVDWYSFRTQPWTSSVTIEAVSSDAIPMELYSGDATTLVASGMNAVSADVVPATFYFVKVGPGAAAAECTTSRYDYRFTASP